MHKQAAQWTRGETTTGSKLATRVIVHERHGMPAQEVDVPYPMDGVVDRVAEWILDTGASYNLIDVRDVVQPTERLRKAQPPKCVTGANGLITLDTVVDTLIPALQESCMAYARPGTANALSMGELCLERVQICLGTVRASHILGW